MSETGTPSTCSTVVLIPVYNDWESLQILLPRLDEVLSDKKIESEVLIVNDASTKPFGSPGSTSFRAIRRIQMMELRRNTGHQRAISLGLSYLESNTTYQTVVVMDADGEDDPADVPRMLEALGNGEQMVFAHRQKRSEGWVFSLFYLLYRNLFATMSGRKAQFGNFSVIPRPILRRIVAVSEIWNHYAIGVLKAKIPYVEVPTRRAKRISGHTHMNFVSLVMHGLSAIAIYGDVIGVRALIATLVLMIPVVLAAFAAVVIRLTTDLAIPGWATYVIAIALVLLLQFIILSFVFVFIILSSRNNSNFLPARDYSYFILDVRVVYP